MFDNIVFNSGRASVREAEHREGHLQLRVLQVQPPAAEGLADDVRPLEAVPPLPKLLETRDAHIEKADHVRRRYFHLQGIYFYFVIQDILMYLTFERILFLKKWFPTFSLPVPKKVYSSLKKVLKILRVLLDENFSVHFKLP